MSWPRKARLKASWRLESGPCCAACKQTQREMRHRLCPKPACSTNVLAALIRLHKLSASLGVEPLRNTGRRSPEHAPVWSEMTALAASHSDGFFRHLGANQFTWR